MGRVIESKELAAASGGQGQYGRRVRELREKRGWKIRTHNDDASLKPGQYRMDEKPPDDHGLVFNRGISAKLRAQVFARNGSLCQMCGLMPGEIDPYTKRPVRLHVGHIKDKSVGGTDDLPNLRTLCSTCNQGAKNVTAEPPSCTRTQG